MFWRSLDKPTRRHNVGSASGPDSFPVASRLLLILTLTREARPRGAQRVMGFLPSQHPPCLATPNKGDKRDDWGRVSFGAIFWLDNTNQKPLGSLSGNLPKLAFPPNKPLQMIGMSRNICSRRSKYFCEVQVKIIVSSLYFSKHRSARRTCVANWSQRVSHKSPRKPAALAAIKPRAMRIPHPHPIPPRFYRRFAQLIAFLKIWGKKGRLQVVYKLTKIKPSRWKDW